MCSLRHWLSKLFQGMPRWTPSAYIWHLPHFPPGMAGHLSDLLLSMCHSLYSICQWHQMKYLFYFCLCRCCVHCLSDRVQLVHHRGPVASWSLHRVCERTHIRLMICFIMSVTCSSYISSSPWLVCASLVYTTVLFILQIACNSGLLGTRFMII